MPGMHTMSQHTQTMQGNNSYHDACVRSNTHSYQNGFQLAWDVFKFHSNHQTAPLAAGVLART